MFPLWFVMIAVSLYEFVMILRQSSNQIIAVNGAKVIQFGLVFAGLLYCLYGDYRIHCHWAKMDLRTVVAEWYVNEGYEIPTILDFHQRYGFTYYFTHDENYNCPGQIVITGYTGAVEEASKRLTQAGAKRVLPLNVSGPFHSPLLEEAGAELESVLEKVAVTSRIKIGRAHV